MVIVIDVSILPDNLRYIIDEVCAKNNEKTVPDMGESKQ